MIMAYMAITQPDKDTPLRMTLCLTRKEVTEIHPYVKHALGLAIKKLASLEKKIAKQKPTDLMLNKKIKTEEQIETLKALFEHVNALALKY